MAVPDRLRLLPSTPHVFPNRLGLVCPRSGRTGTAFLGPDGGLAWAIFVRFDRLLTNTPVPRFAQLNIADNLDTSGTRHLALRKKKDGYKNLSRRDNRDIEMTVHHYLNFGFNN